MKSCLQNEKLSVDSINLYSFFWIEVVKSIFTCSYVATVNCLCGNLCLMTLNKLFQPGCSDTCPNGHRRSVLARVF